MCGADCRQDSRTLRAVITVSAADVTAAESGHRRRVRQSRYAAHRPAGGHQRGLYHDPVAPQYPVPPRLVGVCAREPVWPWTLPVWLCFLRRES